MAVYFFQAGKGGPVKIGHASNPRARKSHIQAHNHETLEIVGLVQGGWSLEHRLHRRFIKLWIRGEWFKCDGELKALIAMFGHDVGNTPEWPRYRLKWRKGGSPFVERVTRFREFSTRDKMFFREVLGRKMAKAYIEKHEIRRKKVA